MYDQSSGVTVSRSLGGEFRSEQSHRTTEVDVGMDKGALTILRDHAHMAGSTFTRAIAFCILDGAGPNVIWDLHLMAADADRAGRRDLADGFAEVADAVEQEWLRREAVRQSRAGRVPRR